MLAELYGACKFCLVDGAYLFYGIFVLAVSVLASRERLQTNLAPIQNKARLPPIPGAELQLAKLQLAKRKPKTSVIADILSLALRLIASFSFFLRIVHFTLWLIRGMFLVSDNPSAIRSFWRYLNVYYLIVVLPAAFMPPVSDAQRAPDGDLLAALILMICVNALGDLISIRIILKIFNRFDPSRYIALHSDKFWDGLKDEAAYYLAVVRGGAYCALVLIGVLMLSSILYAVQVGQIDFGLSADFFRAAWDRALRFPEIASKLYWFRGQPGPFGWAGIPGLFLYGLSTFLPIIILSLLALFWLLLIPFRVAVNLPTTSPVLRVISAETAVFVLCLTTSLTLRSASIL
jgi:hypothetical protein